MQHIYAEIGARKAKAVSLQVLKEPIRPSAFFLEKKPLSHPIDVEM